MQQTNAKKRKDWCSNREKGKKLREYFSKNRGSNAAGKIASS
jgi:hypothetical protein